jgi:replicative DNA helicase
MKALFQKAFKDKSQDYITLLDQIYNFQSEYNSEFITGETINFIKQAKIIEAIKDSYPKIENPDEYGSILENISKAINIDFDKNLGMEFVSQALSILKENKTIKIPTGFTQIDTLLNGGMEGGCVYVFSGIYGIGKSIWLHNMANNLLLNKKYIVLYTLELSEKAVAKRLISHYTQIKQTDFFDKIDDINKQFELLKQLTDTDIIIKQYPVKSASTNTFKQHLMELNQVKGKKPDAILVDYATIMRCINENFNNNSYEEVKKIYEELRALAQELDIPIATAAQVNRGGMEQKGGGTKKGEIITGANIAESIGINMTADFQAIINQTVDDKVNNMMKLYIDKNRFGKSSGLLNFQIDYDYLTIKDILINGV